MRVVRFHKDSDPVVLNPDFVGQFNDLTGDSLIAECGYEFQPISISDDGRTIWLYLDGGTFGQLQVPLGYAGCRDLPRTDKVFQMYERCRRMLLPMDNGDWVEDSLVLRRTAQWMTDVGWPQTEIQRLYDRPWNYIDEINAAVADACLQMVTRE